MTPTISEVEEAQEEEQEEQAWALGRARLEEKRERLVNLYRRVWGTNAGLTSAEVAVMSEEKLDDAIHSLANACDQRIEELMDTEPKIRQLLVEEPSEEPPAQEHLAVEKTRTRKTLAKKREMPKEESESESEPVNLLDQVVDQILGPEKNPEVEESEAEEE